jgi:hypothetical protein
MQAAFDRVCAEVLRPDHAATVRPYQACRIAPNRQGRRAGGRRIDYRAPPRGT